MLLHKREAKKKHVSDWYSFSYNTISKPYDCSKFKASIRQVGIICMEKNVFRKRMYFLGPFTLY